MYFPFFKPQSGGKRFAAQPQTIYSEFPYIYFRRKFLNCQLFIVNCQLKKAFVSSCKRQRHNFLCGTTLVPFFDNGTCARCIGRTRWGLLPQSGGSAHCSEGISIPGLYHLAPTGGSLKRLSKYSCPRPCIGDIVCYEELVKPGPYLWVGS